mmetsp:Transcript_34497/g.63637  ORF Transcript_34497/g.63637 Transcript_34497/m.63637 type:complete len:92 (+) Transcript_34497:277-552(+)
MASTSSVLISSCSTIKDGLLGNSALRLVPNSRPDGRFHAGVARRLKDALAETTRTAMVKMTRAKLDTLFMIIEEIMDQPFVLVQLVLNVGI